jgi:hypothetical protein
MQRELEMLTQANPVASNEAEAWITTPRAQSSHERLIDAIESGATILEPETAIKSRPRASWRVALAAALMVVGVVAVPLWLFGGNRDHEGSPSLPDGTIELDPTHPAMRLLSQGAAGYDAFSATALEQGFEFICTAGGGPPAWKLCLVADNGVLAVVPFNGAEGLTATVSDAHLTHDVVVRMDTNTPVGILDTGPQATVTIEYLGEDVVGDMSAPWAPPSTGP